MKISKVKVLTSFPIIQKHLTWKVTGQYHMTCTMTCEYFYTGNCAFVLYLRFVNIRGKQLIFHRNQNVNNISECLTYFQFLFWFFLFQSVILYLTQIFIHRLYIWNYLWIFIRTLHFEYSHINDESFGSIFSNILIKMRNRKNVNFFTRKSDIFKIASISRVDFLLL